MRSRPGGTTRRPGTRCSCGTRWRSERSAWRAVDLSDAAQLARSRPCCCRRRRGGPGRTRSPTTRTATSGPSRTVSASARPTPINANGTLTTANRLAGQRDPVRRRLELRPERVSAVDHRPRACQDTVHIRRPRQRGPGHRRAATVDDRGVRRVRPAEQGHQALRRGRGADHGDRLRPQRQRHEGEPRRTALSRCPRMTAADNLLTKTLQDNNTTGRQLAYTTTCSPEDHRDRAEGVSRPRPTRTTSSPSTPTTGSVRC